MAAIIEQVPQSYGIRRWGEGYFGINAAGRVTVHPAPERDVAIDLYRLALEVRDAGLAWPVLVRFVDILHDRVRTLCRAFSAVSEELGFRGRYTAVYPVKVNQQHSVVEELLAGGGECVGLEAGSKPELMAVLAAARPGGVIVCNGYKDREYIRLALIGRRLGHAVYIVIEKPSELDLVFAEAADLGIEPLLGVRVRLAAVASGKWQNSGGAKSKFGLSASQVLALAERLRAADSLHWLVLLHSHIGSQIPNLRDIRTALGEAARIYAELRRLGVPLRVVDVGGGLGVDYEGTGTRSSCSMNYSVDSYAREVVWAIAHVCDSNGLPHPEIFTESGRAMTAHHAVLIANVIGREPAPDASGDLAIRDDDHETLHWLDDELRGLQERSPIESYQEASHLFDEVHELFDRGDIGLEQRARAERLFYEIARRVRDRLRPESRRHRELLDGLNELLAERVFCNFSLFQSLPDVWAIEQIFPVMPLHRLDEAPTTSAMLHDLTCDSDGCIQNYVDQDGVETTLPLHAPAEGESYLLGIFMAGAYQEILGDMHNLFGDTDAVNVALTEDGGYRLAQPEKGDAVDELLRYVHFDPELMLERYVQKLRAEGVGEALMDSYYRELKAGLQGYTYLED
ncbi:MAG: biosynthetic arginine decarboxylase [Gammaproteobacteria bacterium]